MVKGFSPPDLPRRDCLRARRLCRQCAAVKLPPPYEGAALEEMPEKGVAHRHYRIAGMGRVLRVPRLSQWELTPDANLAYQEACFRRAEPSGVTPRLFEVLLPCPVLPRGALVVEEIVGAPPRLPSDMDAIAEALARLHSLPVPRPALRPPLADHEADGGFAATLAVVERQLPALEAPGIPSESRRLLLEEFGRVKAEVAAVKPQDQPATLVGTDTHPGNFIVRADGSAVLVDLEKAAYGLPAIDLAHASLPSSTLWDPDVDAVLDADSVAAFHDAYLAGIDPMLAEALRPLLLVARRLTYVRTMMWCARWRLAAAEKDGEWSAALIAPALRTHIELLVSRLFAPGFIAKVLDSF